MRVRLFELRLLAAGLTILWASAGGLVLLAYRPGGPVDLLVGVTATLPLTVSIAGLLWPPLARSSRAFAGVVWLGLAAGLLLVPSISGVASQILARGPETLLPSLEVVYPWLLALLATSLFAGLGVTRHFYGESGFGRRRLVASCAFAVATTVAIGAAFAGASLANGIALRDRPVAWSRFGPTSAADPPACVGQLVAARSAQLSLALSGDVDGRTIGDVELDGARSGSNVRWSAQAATSRTLGLYSAARLGSGAWQRAPGGTWQRVSPATLDDQLLDQTVFEVALSPGNRVAAEERGLEFVEGARARHCRIAIDGPIFEAAFPQARWLVGETSLRTWRGTLDYWIFGDGEVGQVTAFVNGPAAGVASQGLLATIHASLSATYRDAPVSIVAPQS